jgi:hypothetical protein
MLPFAITVVLFMIVNELARLAVVEEGLIENPLSPLSVVICVVPYDDEETTKKTITSE